MAREICRGRHAAFAWDAAKRDAYLASLKAFKPRRGPASFACALFRHFAAGVPRLPAAVLDARQAACTACPNKTEGGPCKLCGCRVEGRILTKISLPLETCPDTPPRWGPLPVADTRWRRIALALLAPLLRLCR